MIVFKSTTIFAAFYLLPYLALAGHDSFCEAFHNFYDCCYEGYYSYYSNDTCNPIPNVSFSMVTTLAGNGTAGHKDGMGAQAVLNRPHGLAQDKNGVLYFADRGNHQIRSYIPASGEVVTIAGAGVSGFADGRGNKAQFNQPVAVVASYDGTLYVADRDNHRIRVVDQYGAVKTLAGNGIQGFQDGMASEAQFSEPYGVALNENETFLLVADYLNHAIRKVDLKSGVVSTVAGNGKNGLIDGFGTGAQFNQPYNIVRDHTGNFLIPDQKNHAIRRMSANSWYVSTVAGNGQSGYQDGDKIEAQFNNPTGLAISHNGTIYVADRNNHRIRKILNGSNVYNDIKVETLAGTGVNGDLNGEMEKAQFSKPLDILIDNQSGQLILSEDTGHKLRIIK